MNIEDWKKEVRWEASDYLVDRLPLIITAEFFNSRISIYFYLSENKNSYQSDNERESHEKRTRFRKEKHVDVCAYIEKKGKIEFTTYTNMNVKSVLILELLCEAIMKYY